MEVHHHLSQAIAVQTRPGFYVKKSNRPAIIRLSYPDREMNNAFDKVNIQINPIMLLTEELLQRGYVYLFAGKKYRKLFKCGAYINPNERAANLSSTMDEEFEVIARFERNYYFAIEHNVKEIFYFRGYLLQNELFTFYYIQEALEVFKEACAMKVVSNRPGCEVCGYFSDRNITIQRHRVNCQGIPSLIYRFCRCFNLDSSYTIINQIHDPLTCPFQ